MAQGSHNLASVIMGSLNGDLMKAEELAREAVRIRTLMHGKFYHSVGNSCNLLAGILVVQKKLGDETKKLIEHTLAILIRNEGPDKFNTAVGHKYG